MVSVGSLLGTVGDLNSTSAHTASSYSRVGLNNVEMYRADFVQNMYKLDHFYVEKHFLQAVTDCQLF